MFSQEVVVAIIAQQRRKRSPLTHEQKTEKALYTETKTNKANRDLDCFSTVQHKALIPTLRKESREPFSMYSVMIITGLPEGTNRNL